MVRSAKERNKFQTNITLVPTYTQVGSLFLLHSLLGSEIRHGCGFWKSRHTHPKLSNCWWSLALEADNRGEQKALRTTWMPSPGNWVAAPPQVVGEATEWVCVVISPLRTRSVFHNVAIIPDRQLCGKNVRRRRLCAMPFTQAPTTALRDHLGTGYHMDSLPQAICLKKK